MKRLSLVVACFALAGCASLEKTMQSAWPTPRIEYVHAATHSQVRAIIKAWSEATPGNYDCHATPTGSMLPYIKGGAREFLLIEPTGPDTPLEAGHVVIFFRDADAPRCLHMIARIEGEMVYMSGTNNKWSDGWYNRSQIYGILRRVVTLPAP